jgi:uncharacterized protein (TIGR02147 family)
METAAQQFDSMQEFLQTKLFRLREKNPHFSGRAFAKRLGISPGALSEILNGARPVTRKLAVRVCDRLLLDPMERALVLKKFPDRKVKAPRTAVEEALDYLKLSADQFKLMSEWYYFAILSLMKTADFKSDVDHVAVRLGLSRTQVQHAVETMIRLRIIELQPDGTWVRGQAGHRTTDGLRNLSIRKSHQETLELARESLTDEKFDQTDFSALTFPLDVEDLPAAKERIRKFQNELYETFNRDKKPREVYRLAVQLFPLTKIQTPRKPE